MWRGVSNDFGHERFLPFGVSGEEALLQEVFLLAYKLHWSRQEILALPVPERRRYLKLLGEQLQREQETITPTGKT